MFRIGLLYTLLLSSGLVFCQTITIDTFPKPFEPDYLNVYPQADGTLVYLDVVGKVLYDCDENFNNCIEIKMDLSYFNNHTGLKKINHGAYVIMRNNRIGVYDPIKQEIFSPESNPNLVAEGEVYMNVDETLYKYNFTSGEPDFILDENVVKIVASPDHFYVEIRQSSQKIFKEYDKNWNLIGSIPQLYKPTNNHIKVYEYDKAGWSNPSFYHTNVFELYASNDDGFAFETIKTINGDALDQVFVFNEFVYYRYESRAVEGHNSGSRSMALIGRINVLTLEVEEIPSNGLEPLMAGIDHIYQRRHNSIYKYVNGSFDEVEIINVTPILEKNIFKVEKIRTSPAGDVFIKSSELLYKYDATNHSWNQILDGVPIKDFDLNDQGEIYFISDEIIWKSLDEGNSFEFVSDYLKNPLMIKWTNGNNWLSRGSNNWYEPPLAIGSNEFDCSIYWNYFPYVVHTSYNDGNSWNENYIYYNPFSCLNSEIDYTINSEIYYYGNDDRMYFQSPYDFVTLSPNFSRTEINMDDLSYVIKIAATKNNKVIAVQSNSKIFYTESFDQINWQPIEFGSTIRDLGQGHEDESLFILSGENNVHYTEDLKSGFQEYLVVTVEDSLTPILNINEISYHIDKNIYLTHSNNTISRVINIEKAENTISGNVFVDENSSCLLDGGETALEINITFSRSLRSWSVFSEDGNFELNLEDGTYDIEYSYDEQLWELCSPPKQITIENGEQKEIQVPFIAKDSCNNLELRISSTQLHPGYPAAYLITLINAGNEPSPESKVEIVHDETLSDFSIDGPHQILDSQTILLDYPSLDINQQYSFEIKARIDSIAIIGQTHCLNGSILNYNNCNNEMIEANHCLESNHFSQLARKTFNGHGEADRFFEIDEWIYVNITAFNLSGQSFNGFKISEQINPIIDFENMELLGSNYNVSFEFDYPNKIEFKSDDIIPDLGEDSLSAHININYRIKANSTALEGDEWNGTSIFQAENLSASSTIHFRKECGQSAIVFETYPEICSSDGYYGHYREGRYKIIHNSSTGCDSIEYANLIVHPKYYINLSNQELCPGEEFLGSTDEGLQSITLHTEFGCDSLIRFNIIYLEVDENTEKYKTLCPNNSLSLSSDTIIIDTMFAENGCPYFHFEHYEVLHYTELYSEEFAEICEGQQYKGFTTNGTHQLQFNSIDGCDSIHAIHLTLNETFEETLDVSICYNEEYQGLTESGNYKFEYVTTAGCDSIIHINLEVFAFQEFNAEAQICEGEFYQSFSEPGIFEVWGIDKNGCDSLTIIDLDVLPVYQKSDTIILCKESNFEGLKIGNHILNLFNEDGCDSIVALTILRSDDPYCTNLFEGNTLEISETEFVTVFPNPFAERLHIKIEKQKLLPTELTVINAAGKIIYKDIINQTDWVKDMSDLTTGIYYIILTAPTLNLKTLMCKI